MVSSSPEPKNVVAWMAVLDRIQTTLGQSLELAQESPPVPPPTTGLERQPLQSLNDRLARLQNCLARAEQNANEVENLLTTQADALKQWLQSISVVQQKLAQWPSRVL